MLNIKIENDIAKSYQEEIGAPFQDCLTGLVNYGFFHMTMDREINRCERYGGRLSLALVGIDAFRSYNKTYGLLAGEQLLKMIAGVINNSIRQVDLAARFSGDTFAVIFAESSPESAFQAAERIRANVENLTDRPTVSIGLAGYSGDVNTAQALLEKAQEALLKSKTMGKNIVTIFDEPEIYDQSNDGKILIVDDNDMNLKLLAAMLAPLNYAVQKATNAMDAIHLLEKTDIDLILLDVMMPEMDGFEACRRIKNNPRTQMTPIILVTALDDMESKIKGIESGADDFLTKPPNRPELIARTRSLIKMKKLSNSFTSIENVLFSLARAVEAKDTYTQGHTERVSNLSLALGKKMGLSHKEMTALSYGGIMHDIGKIGVPNEILNKNGPLDNDEWNIMQQHPDMGYKIGLPLEKSLGLALQVIRSHHEKMDGSGYPDGLKGDEVPMAARIVGIVDIYDALTTDRPYRKAMPKEKAFNILKEEAEDGKLDKNIVTALIDYLNNQNFTSEGHTNE